jgi:hypothetical protein
MKDGALMHRLVVRENALPAALFRRVLRKIQALGETGLRNTYQTTFFMPRDANPSCGVEEAVEILWPALKNPSSDFAGAEWWLSRMRTSNVKVDFHRDLDERLYHRTGRRVFPAHSSVLFLNRCKGGLLALTHQPPNPKNPAFAPTRPEFDLIDPKPNRFVQFDTAMTHGVLDAENQIPGRRLPREKNLRLAVIINLWRKRPFSTPTFLESGSYRALL